jgi:hypothetical protein
VGTTCTIPKRERGVMNHPPHFPAASKILIHKGLRE